MTKSPEDIAEVLVKWQNDAHPNPTTTIEREECLRWYYGAGGYIAEDIKTLKRFLELETETKVAPDTSNMATRLLAWAEEEGVYLFGSDGEGFVRLSTDGRREIWPVDSRQFKRYLTKLLFDREGKPPGPTPLENTIRLASALAIFDRPQHELHNRVAWQDGELWFDLRNQEGEAVKVTAGEGWKITKPPILFRRYRHQKPAVTPVGVEDVQVIFERFLDLVNHDPKTPILHKVQLVTSFIPDMPHPVSNYHGEQGSAKTCFSEFLKRLIDPSIVATHMMPRSQEELVQCLSHHWMVVFDNVSDLTDWQSDVLCRAVTGVGLQKRKLYTDDDDIIYTFKRVVALNGINVAAIRPDLLDRSILHEFPSIPIEDRITIDEFWERFDSAAPEIMGAVFTVLSMAMKILPTVQKKGLYRMADFTRWGIAIAEAIGYKREDFIKEYATNLKGANLQALESHTVGVVLLEFMVSYNDVGRVYKDTPTNVFKQLEEVAGTRVASNDWPANAQSLGRIMNDLKTNLERQGILFTRGVGKDREWAFTPIETAGQLTLNRFFSDEEDKKESSGDPRYCLWEHRKQDFVFAISQPSQLSVDRVRPHVGLKDKKDMDSTVSSGDCEDSEVPKKILPRNVKQFEKWLSLLPNAGLRGFKESDVKRAYGEGYLKQLAKYEKKSWIEQREDSKTWWISNTGEAALRGDP